MAKRKAIEISGSDMTAAPGDAADKPQAGTELPTVASPPISPATSEITAEPVVAEELAAPPTETVSAPADEAPAASFTLMHMPRFHLRPRHKRYALLAASVAIAAAFGAVVGAAATGGFSRTAGSRHCDAWKKTRRHSNPLRISPRKSQI